MSTLFRRANGYYYIVTDLKDGSRRWISTKTKNRSAALRKLGEEESNPVTVSAMRLSEFKEDFLAYAKTVFSAGTNKIYRQALTHFENFTGDICLDAVKPKHIDFFKSQRLKTVRPQTLNINLRTIRSAFYTAQRWGYIKENPFRGVKQCRVEEITPLFINEVEAKRIIDTVRERWMKDAVALTSGLTDRHVWSLTASGLNLFAGARGGVWKRSMLEMITVSYLQSSSKSLNFNKVRTGQYKDTTVTIRNSGNDTLKISSIVSNRSEFIARPNVMQIPQGQSITDTLRFAPTVVGTDSALIIIKSNSIYSPDTIKVVGIAIPLTGVEVMKEMPTIFRLDQSYPNPTNPSTTISYAIPTRSHVTLSVYNTLGQKVTELVNAEKEAGAYNATFDASRLASGVYLYRIQAGSFVQTKKLLVVK